MRPSDIRPLAAMAKRALPHEFQPIPKDAHRPKISRYSVVLIEALQNAPLSGVTGFASGKISLAKWAHMLSIVTDIGT